MEIEEKKHCIWGLYTAYLYKHCSKILKKCIYMDNFKHAQKDFEKSCKKLC